MTTQPEALRLADECDEGMVDFAQAAAEMRRLYLVEQALDRCRVVCDATSEGWRADAERWQAQRDALLEALKELLNAESSYPWSGWSESELAAIEKAHTAIKQAEGETR